MPCDPDGMTRFELDGRRYVGRTIAGKRAINMHGRIHRLMAEASKDQVLVDPRKPEPEQRAEAMGVILSRVGRMVEAEALADETLAGYLIERPGLPALNLPTDLDEAYRGRPAEWMTAAMKVWDIEGFFRFAGTKAPAPQTETVPPPQPPSDTV